MCPRQAAPKAPRVRGTNPQITELRGHPASSMDPALRSSLKDASEPHTARRSKQTIPPLHIKCLFLHSILPTIGYLWFTISLTRTSSCSEVLPDSESVSSDRELLYIRCAFSSDSFFYFRLGSWKPSRVLTREYSDLSGRTGLVTIPSCLAGLKRRLMKQDDYHNSLADCFTPNRLSKEILT